ncbi:MAG: NAD(P)-dependent oxidoreductase [Bacteroidota bacterium]
MKVLVIGGTGFIGYHIVHELINKGHEAGVLALPSLSERISLPETVEIVLADLNAMNDGQLSDLLAGYESFVFAAGADDRSLPDSPAYRFFEKANVAPLIRLINLAKPAGMDSGLVMGSYFTHFNRLWPDLRLAEHHPYIRSRLDQQQLGFAAAGNGFRLIFLELPFIFGSMPGRKPLWAPLLSWLHSPWPVFYPGGGTAVVSVKTVAAAAVEALLNGKNGSCYPIGEENQTWKTLFSALQIQLKRQSVTYPLPDWILKSILKVVWFVHKIKGTEGGLDFRYLPDILLREAFLPVDSDFSPLQFKRYGMEEAFSETLTGAGFNREK